MRDLVINPRKGRKKGKAVRIDLSAIKMKSNNKQKNMASASTWSTNIMGQTVLLCTTSNDCMAPYWGPRGAYVMS
jgi:hypothetical protein